MPGACGFMWMAFRRSGIQQRRSRPTLLLAVRQNAEEFILMFTERAEAEEEDYGRRCPPCPLRFIAFGLLQQKGPPEGQDRVRLRRCPSWLGHTQFDHNCFPVSVSAWLYRSP